jgi:hypothetical protein
VLDLMPFLTESVAREWLSHVTAQRDLWDAYAMGYGPQPAGPSLEAVLALREALLTGAMLLETETVAEPPSTQLSVPPAQVAA